MNNLKIHEGINELESLETSNLGQYSVEGQEFSFPPSGSVHPKKFEEQSLNKEKYL